MGASSGGSISISLEIVVVVAASRVESSRRCRPRGVRGETGNLGTAGEWRGQPGAARPGNRGRAPREVVWITGAAGSWPEAMRGGGSLGAEKSMRARRYKLRALGRTRGSGPTSALSHGCPRPVQLLTARGGVWSRSGSFGAAILAVRAFFICARGAIGATPTARRTVVSRGGSSRGKRPRGGTGGAERASARQRAGNSAFGRRRGRRKK
jgi:hypothetical protein